MLTITIYCIVFFIWWRSAEIDSSIKMPVRPWSLWLLTQFGLWWGLKYETSVNLCSAMSWFSVFFLRKLVAYASASSKKYNVLMSVKRVIQMSEVEHLCYIWLFRNHSCIEWLHRFTVNLALISLCVRVPKIKMCAVTNG